MKAILSIGLQGVGMFLVFLVSDATHCATFPERLSIIGALFFFFVFGISVERWLQP